MRPANLMIAFLLLSGVLVAFEGCMPVKGCTDGGAVNYNPNATKEDGSCLYATTFYFDQPGPPATVVVGTETRIVTASYQHGPPVCGSKAAGCANFTLPYGDLDYSASSANYQWVGTVGSTETCSNILLQQITSTVTFYTNTNHGTVTVTINDSTAQFSGVFNQPPSCADNGTASFFLLPGTYTYTASSTTGAGTWSGSINVVTNDRCYLQLLP